MANVKCSQCGTVWDVNNPPKSKPAAQPATDSTPTPKTKSAASKRRQTAMIALAGSLFSLLALAGLGIILFTGGDEPQQEQAPPVVAEAPVEKGTYRIVKLPESTRKKIYHDYRLASGSSVEKKVMVTKDSVAAKTLGKTMNLIMDREVTHMALLNNISEEDVMQIVAEGNAEGWPPKKKAKPQQTSK
ncbi:hypothetical protein [Stieleria marina]